jgi:hypothetical protein
MKPELTSNQILFKNIHTMQKRLLLLSLMLLFSSVSFGQMNRVKEVTEAAGRGAQAYLEKIPPGHESRYGFNNREEFARVEMGKPYQIIILKKELFEDPEMSGDDYLQPLDEWRVPLMVDRENRAFLTVARVKGQLKTVGLGAAGLAGELGEFEKQHPSRQSHGKILRVHKMTCDFVILPNEANPAASTLFPLQSAKNSLRENGESAASFQLNRGLQLIRKYGKNN